MKIIEVQSNAVFPWLRNSDLDLSQICFFQKLDLLRNTLSLFETRVVLTLVFKGQD